MVLQNIIRQTENDVNDDLLIPTLADQQNEDSESNEDILHTVDDLNDVDIIVATYDILEGTFNYSIPDEDISVEYSFLTEYDPEIFESEDDSYDYFSYLDWESSNHDYYSDFSICSDYDVYEDDSERLINNEFRKILEQQDTFNITTNEYKISKKLKKLKRNKLGKNKIRHLENELFLKHLGKLSHCDVDDASSADVFRFSHLQKSADSDELLSSFTNGAEYEITDDCKSKKKRKRNGKKKNRNSLVNNNAFDNLTQAERKFFKQRSAPLGIINYLDSKVIKFFHNRPTATFVSDPISSFERMILHGIAHFYGLRSTSFNDRSTGARLTKILNSSSTFDPVISISTYLETLHKTEQVVIL